MSILAWLVVGLIAGFLASKVVNKTGSGLVMDIVLGVVGALVGGFLFNAIGHAAPNGINIYSIFVSFIGAVIVLLVYHAIIRRRAV
ncbi:MAG: GlsB/YeaQ/YmgE family stress response membrane protein [Alphaproteobacteria bacterium]|nr:GlsB/YeaQ/YmgE family stress response membrane protein [Alphaproteobacteria bacterium]MBU1514550.1 GlsB/YeaQ/YmgE family stress response membrane protein [Alphaproteobacteria bacterium]MBU2096818.1 GlsB/YeaQ/YmgE family stress response membrane protein [Alphaproteobacteria bacterium]MBU2153445.1 GlsB/YeaQ/YmgE family stress response membrane protein [Alphaproteobacteria bacterium]MBU2306050.1 GlsB/YeaQ/YmgE family stress response membrane protein [Alphaproteobacteria bacterium]